MSLRYLFGPVTDTFAEQNLDRQCRSGACRTFGPDEGTDLAIKAGESLQDVYGRFPDSWRPDFLVLNLAYATVPQCLWTAPLPKVALATDAHLLWHYYRERLPECDLVLTDALAAEMMERSGISARAAKLCGCERVFIEEADGLGSPSYEVGADGLTIRPTGAIPPLTTNHSPLTKKTSTSFSSATSTQCSGSGRAGSCAWRGWGGAGGCRFAAECLAMPIGGCCGGRGSCFSSAAAARPDGGRSRRPMPAPSSFRKRAIVSCPTGSAIAVSASTIGRTTWSS